MSSCLLTTIVTVKIILQVFMKYGIIQNMSSYIKKAFDITRKNIIIIQPLVLFLIIYTFTSSAVFQLAHKITYIVFLTANILLATAFLSGWLYMIKKTIAHNKKAENDEYKDEKAETEASLALGKEFFPGVGDYFPAITFTVLCYVAVFILLMFVSLKAGLRFMPPIDINWSDFMAAANSTPVEMQKYVASLSFAQLKAINLWMFYMGGISSLFMFLTMFLFPAAFDKKEQYFFVPFSAFNRNIVFIFKHFFGSLGIIIFLYFLQLVFSILSVFFSINIILSVIGLILSFYFVTYAIVLIFLYYEEGK